jgi:hypothetical protein
MKEEIYDIKGIKITRPVYDGKVEILVKADVNDADYIRKTEYMSIDEFATLLPIIKKLMNYTGSKYNGYGHNWQHAHKYLTEEEVELFSEYLPYMDNEEVHTIEAVDVWYRSPDGIRYDVAIDYNEE